MTKLNVRHTGPTPLPPEVRAAGAMQVVSHRSEEFRGLLARIEPRLMQIFGSVNPVLTVAGSGTGGLDAAILNCIYPEDAVIAVSVGEFGDRFADLATSRGARVTRLNFAWGDAIDPEELRALLRRVPDVRAVLMTHNETSTGVLNPLSDLCEVVRAESEALILVDAVSSVGATPLEVDRLHIDVAVGVTQKALMSPPGLALVSLSPRAMRIARSMTAVPHSLSFARMADSMASGTTPFTPPVTLFFALDAALALIESEGLESVFRRHAQLAHLCRDELQNAGLELSVRADSSSPTVTTIRLPSDRDAGEIVARLESQFGLQIGRGRGLWADTHLRVGHMGWVSSTEVLQAAASIGALVCERGSY